MKTKFEFSRFYCRSAKAGTRIKLIFTILELIKAGCDMTLLTTHHSHYDASSKAFLSINVHPDKQIVKLKIMNTLLSFHFYLFLFWLRIRKLLGQIKKIPMFRVTRPYLNLLVKPRGLFSGFLGKI